MRDEKNEGIAFMSNFVSIIQQVLKKKIMCQSIYLLIYPKRNVQGHRLIVAQTR